MLARALGVICCVMVVSAASADDWYSAVVPVPDRTTASLDRALASALEQVLVRVSGDAQLAKYPGTAKLLSNARDRVSLYSYSEREQGLAVQAQFDSSIIKSLLRQLRASFWAPPRPTVLVWLVADEAEGRRFVNFADDPQLVTALIDGFKGRGVPVRFPLLDLEDTANLSPDGVWQKAMPDVIAASERYGVEHVLVGRFVQLSSGQAVGDWLYYGPAFQRSVELSGVDAVTLMSAGVQVSVDAMVEQYAVKLDDDAFGGRVRVRVEGVSGYDDYRGVMAVLESIIVVDDVSVTRIDQDQLGLIVAGVSNAEVFMRLLPEGSGLEAATDRRLVDASLSDSVDVRLVWMPKL